MFFHNMPFLNDTPLLMVMAFLLLTLLVGIYCKGKPTSLREYAIGNKNFATATLVATMLATAYDGAGLLRNVEQTYLQGLYWIGFSLSGSLGYWILSPLLLRMGPFMGHLSLVETLGYSYGSIVRMFMALVCILQDIFYLASQIAALSTAIKMCTGVNDPRYMTAVATCMLIVYASFGGIRSVTLTDVLQLVTFSLVIPLLVIWLSRQVEQPIIPVLQSYPKFKLTSLYGDKQYWAIVALFLANLASFIQPTTIQRVYMAAGLIQARKLFIYSGMFSLMIKLCIIFIALFLFVQNPTLSQAAIWPTIFAHLTPAFKGLIAISLVAMVMSTIDSILNSCAVMASHDLKEAIRSLASAPSYPLAISTAFKRSLLNIIDAIPALSLARWATIVMGGMAMLVAFLYNDLLKILIIILNFSVPITVAPYLLALYGLRSSSYTALIGMVTGVLTIKAWNQWIEPATHINGAFICMLANGLAMLAAHYLLPQPAGKGWVGPDDEYQAIQQSRERAAKRRREK